jgi:quinolinate synthase
MTTAEGSRRIDELRAGFGKDVLILGHHYQRPAVLAHADIRGDSLELARAAGASGARRIVMCGVRFMAESADILTGGGQIVYMPDTRAGCPMADMADDAGLSEAWKTVTSSGGEWVPVAYVNSSAKIKAFCGRNGGATCTSSSAAKVFRWALERGRKLLFVPDEHLGRNTAADIGLPDNEIAVYDPRSAGGGLDRTALGGVRLVVWRGFCLVHAAFTESDILRVRERIPNARIIVHPETPRAVVAMADAHGSTSQIIRYVEDAPEGSTIVIGTEINLVESLADRHRGRVSIKALAPSICANMARINEINLLQLLETWPADRVVSVPMEVASDARAALDRMLKL